MSAGLLVELRKVGAYWCVYVHGVRTVDRESYQVAANVAHALEHPEQWEATECHEVADAIRRWVAEGGLRHPYGDKRADDCRCEARFTCGPCLAKAAP